MTKRNGTLVLTVLVATPAESANVPALLKKLGGEEGEAELVATSFVRGDVAAYKERRAAREAKPGPAKAKPRAEKHAKRAAQKAAAG